MNQVDIKYEGNIIETVRVDTKFLDLQYKDIVDITKIEGLEYLSNLEKLDLSVNQIQRIEGLDALVNLKTLDLAENQIERIKGFDQLVNLQRLELNCNQIQRIEGLDALMNLQVLELRDNQIHRIEGLEQLQNLKELNLGTNQIQRIEGLDTLVNLKELYLDNNQIQQIEGLERLANLSQFDIDDNVIPNDMLEKLNGLRSDEAKARFFVEYCMKERGMQVIPQRDQDELQTRVDLHHDEDKRYLSKLRQIIKVSNSMEISRLASVLKIDDAILWDRIFDWAEQFGFRIEDNKVIFGNGDMTGFIDELEAAFGTWEGKEKGRDGKI